MRRGESKAFAQLYERYRNNVWRYCARMVKDGQAADDIVQNVFIKLQQRSTEIRNGHSLQSWIFAVARNESFEELRKRRLDAIDENVIWDGGMPDEELENKERKEVIYNVIMHLQPNYREVVLLREYEQMTYEEIAAVTQTSLSSVKSRLFKARKVLIEKLKPYFEREAEL